MPTLPGALRIARIGLNVADLAKACAFYEAALGFRVMSRETREGPAFAALTGIYGARAEVAVLALGGREIELVAYAEPGRPYPQPRRANDPWFQHFAVVVADMDAAYAALRRQGEATPISPNGPQLLPPEAGSIVAYKFRDPDGHPLELSWFPPAVAGAWADPPPGEVFLGVDHSAIGVADMGSSLAFYVDGLGMALAARQVNSGTTQDGLDGMAGVAVDIVRLKPPQPEPHLELLSYRTPRSNAPPFEAAVNDLAATRLVIEVRDLEALIQRLRQAGGRLASGELSAVRGAGRAALVRDPDGRLVELHEAEA